MDDCIDRLVDLWKKATANIDNMRVCWFTTMQALSVFLSLASQLANVLIYMSPCPVLQEESVRNATIHRDNKLLLDKMEHIKRTGGYTDHRNKYLSKR